MPQCAIRGETGTDRSWVCIEPQWYTIRQECVCVCVCGGGVASTKREARAQIFRHAPDLTVRP